MFHVGHLNILKRAKEQCDFLIVGVSTDDNVQQYKHKTPVVPYEQRKEIVAAIRYVDQVVPQENMDKFAAWEKYHFDAIFHGDDWKGSPMYDEIEKQLSAVGCEVVFLPHTEGSVSIIGNNCCACKTCEQSCPVRAIAFKKDEDGYEQVCVDSNICIACGLCEKVCPILTVRKPDKREKPDLCGAAFAIDDDAKEKGSSGGLFAVFAQHVIDGGGVVYGARRPAARQDGALLCYALPDCRTSVLFARSVRPFDMRRICLSRRGQSAAVRPVYQVP